MFAGLGVVGLSILAAAVLAVVLFLWAKTPPERVTTHVGLAIIVGGAIGNLIDRVRLGYVVDYVYFHTPGLGLRHLQSRRRLHHRRRGDDPDRRVRPGAAPEAAHGGMGGTPRD